MRLGDVKCQVHCIVHQMVIFEQFYLIFVYYADDKPQLQNKPQECYGQSAFCNISQTHANVKVHNDTDPLILFSLVRQRIHESHSSWMCAGKFVDHLLRIQW